MPQLSIIIPVWNLWEMTQNCLESIATHCSTDSLWEQLEIIVVDNGSTDATKEALAPTLQRLFGSKAQAITLPENYGFAKACNKGAKAAKAELLFFLNNDTLFTPHCLPPLLSTLRKNTKLGIVGPLLLYPDDTVQHAGICFNHAFEPIHIYRFVSANYGPVHTTRTWQAITGAAMLMRSALFHSCGGFHEGYINGFEDLDLCCQIRAQDLQIGIANQSRIYHLASQTPGRFEHDSANATLLDKRYPQAFCPDYHRIALEEGLYPQLSPDFELYITLPKVKSRALTHVFTKNFAPEQCYAHLEAEPFWLEGYDLLARNLETFQLWESAMTYRLLQCRLAPLQEHIQALALCAARGGQKNLVASAQQDIQKIQRTVQNFATLINKAQILRQWARDKEDTALEQLFDTWFNTYTQQ